MSDNSAIPVISYKLYGSYTISDIFNRDSLIDMKDIASNLFHDRNVIYNRMPKPHHKSYKDFLGYVAASIYEHLQSDYDVTKPSRSSFHKSFDFNCYIVDEEQAYKWIGDKTYKYSTNSSSLGMVTSNQPISIVLVSYEMAICDIYTGRQEPQNLLGCQIVSKPDDFWAEHIEKVDKAQKKHKRAIFNGGVADKVILTSVE